MVSQAKSRKNTHPENFTALFRKQVEAKVTALKVELCAKATKDLGLAEPVDLEEQLITARNLYIKERLEITSAQMVRLHALYRDVSDALEITERKQMFDELAAEIKWLGTSGY